MRVFTHPLFKKIDYHRLVINERGCMYLLTVKDGLVTRYVGPYATPQKASDDLERVLSSCSGRANWQIHALESPTQRSFSDRLQERKEFFTAAAS